MAGLIVAVRARIYREGVAAALAARRGLEVVGVHSSASSAIEATLSQEPDILLIDAGLSGASECMRHLSGGSRKVRIIALAVDDNDAELLSWAEAGAVGFVTCENSIDELVCCIESALRGELVCTPHLSAVLAKQVARLAARLDSDARADPAVALTPRQAQILASLQRGKTNKQIARELGIELATVKNHVHQVLQRLNVRRRREVAASLLGARASGEPAVAPHR